MNKSRFPVKENTGKRNRDWHTDSDLTHIDGVEKSACSRATSGKYDRPVIAEIFINQFNGLVQPVHLYGGMRANWSWPATDNWEYVSSNQPALLYVWKQWIIGLFLVCGEILSQRTSLSTWWWKWMDSINKYRWIWVGDGQADKMAFGSRVRIHPPPVKLPTWQASVSRSPLPQK